MAYFGNWTQYFFWRFLINMMLIAGRDYVPGVLGSESACPRYPKGIFAGHQNWRVRRYPGAEIAKALAGIGNDVTPLKAWVVHGAPICGLCVRPVG
jgi:hypothetical protein